MKSFLAVLGSVCPLVAQSILHVGPGQPFADIQAAIGAAVPGDRVLVHAGTYPQFVLDRGVIVRAEPVGAAVVVMSPTNPANVVVALPGGQNAIVQGLQVWHPIEVRPPAGANATGVLSLLQTDSRAGIDITDANVTMQGCFAAGSLLEGVTLHGAAALDAVQCEIAGGHNGNIVFAPIDGLWAEQQAQVHLSNCTVRGGSRAWVHSTFFGGNGVGLAGSARGWFVDCTLQAYQQSGFPGVGLDNQSGVPAVLERVLTQDNVGQSPSVAGASQNSLLLGVSSATPLLRGSTFQLDFATRPGLPVIAHVSLQLDAPTPFAVVAQPVWGFAQYSLQFAFAVGDAQGRASVPFSIPNSAWLQDLPLWFCAWSEQNLPVQLSPVIGGIVR